MQSSAPVAQGVGNMKEQRYAAAGWLSIVGAVLFSISFVVGIGQAVIAGKAFGYHGPVIGPSEWIIAQAQQRHHSIAVDRCELDDVQAVFGGDEGRLTGRVELNRPDSEAHRQ